MAHTRMRVVALATSLFLFTLVTAHFTTRVARGSPGVVGVIAYERGNEIRLIDS